MLSRVFVCPRRAGGGGQDRLPSTRSFLGEEVGYLWSQSWVSGEIEYLGVGYLGRGRGRVSRGRVSYEVGYPGGRVSWGLRYPGVGYLGGRVSGGGVFVE